MPAQPILGAAEFAVLFGPMLALVAVIAIGVTITHIKDMRS